MKLETTILCIGAMGFYPTLYVEHGLRRAWFCNADATDAQGGLCLETVERYGKEIEYRSAIRAMYFINKGFEAVRKDKTPEAYSSRM